MSSNSASTKNKRQEEKYVQMIRDLVALPMNKQCFDCNSKGPTYVDVTVGSFVCTTCSGLLRGLNPPHRVKSINMSTFTQDEVEFMRNHGNQLNKMIYLSLYDANAGFSPDPKDTERFKEFLSQKYERKRWYAEPTEAMRQKVRAELDATLDKTGHTSKSTSSLPHSQSITNSIKSPPEPASTVSSTANRTTRTSSVPSSQQQQQPPPMLVFDAPVTNTTTTPSSTSLFDSFLTTSPTQKTASPTTNFFPDQPFGSTTATASSNDTNWGAFMEPTKPTTTTTTVSPPLPTMINPTTMQSNNFAHPPPEPADKYAALSELFSSQNTIQDHHHHHQHHPQSTSIFGNTSNGGAHQPAMANNLFGQSPFSSLPSSTTTSNPSANKFPSTNMFAAPTFPSNSNPFVQQTPFGTNPSNLFPMPTNNNPPNPFLNIAQQPSTQPLANQFGKPRANSTNPFL